MNTEHPSDIIFFRFLKGALPENEAAEVRLHLCECRECMESYLNMREMEQLGILEPRRGGKRSAPVYPLFGIDCGYGGASGAVAAAAFSDSADDVFFTTDFQSDEIGEEAADESDLDVDFGQDEEAPEDFS